jgi:hypothetical protein
MRPFTRESSAAWLTVTSSESGQPILAAGWRVVGRTNPKIENLFVDGTSQSVRLRLQPLAEL